MFAPNLLTLGLEELLEKLRNSKDFDGTAIYVDGYGFEDRGGFHGNNIIRGPVIKPGQSYSINYFAIYDQINDSDVPCFTCGLPYSCERLSKRAESWLIPSEDMFGMCFFCYQHYVGFNDNYTLSSDYKPIRTYDAVYTYHFGKEQYFKRTISYEQILRVMKDEKFILKLLQNVVPVSEISEEIQELMDNDQQVGKYYEQRKVIKKEFKMKLGTIYVDTYDRGLIPVNTLPTVLQTSRDHLFTKRPNQKLRDEYKDYYDDWYNRRDGIKNDHFYKQAFQFLTSHQLTKDQLEHVILNHHDPGVILLTLFLYDDPTIFSNLPHEIVSNFEHYFKIEPYHITQFKGFQSFTNCYLFFKGIEKVPSEFYSLDYLEDFLYRAYSLPSSPERNEILKWAMVNHGDSRGFDLPPAELINFVDVIVDSIYDYSDVDSLISSLVRYADEDVNTYKDAINLLVNVLDSGNDLSRFCNILGDSGNKPLLHQFYSRVLELPNWVEFVISLANNLETFPSLTLELVLLSLIHVNQFKLIQPVRKMTKERIVRFNRSPVTRIFNNPFFTTEKIKNTDLDKFFNESYLLEQLTDFYDWHRGEMGFHLDPMDETNLMEAVETPISGIYHKLIDDITFSIFHIYGIILKGEFEKIKFNRFPIELFSNTLSLSFTECSFEKIPSSQEPLDQLASLSFIDCTIHDIDYDFFRFPNIREIRLFNCRGLDKENIKSYFKRDTRKYRVQELESGLLTIISFN